MTSVTNAKTSSRQTDDIDIGRLIGELIDHRKLIISLTSCFTLIAICYALFATPIYQANALVQVEQKQGNAILNSLTQMLPDAQPQSAPEVVLLRSRMILGKTVDDLNLQVNVTPKYFPIFGQGLARLTGDVKGDIEITDLFLQKNNKDQTPEVTLTVKSNNSFQVEGEGFKLDGVTGKPLIYKDIKLLVKSINAQPGDRFKVRYYSRLKAISNLLENFSVADQGKDTGMLTLSLTGNDRNLITKTLDSISQNYLEQNVERQAAQDAKSLDFLNMQLPKVRSDLDAAENKLNAYRRQSDSVDLSLEAKAVLDQIVNVDNQLNEITFREAEISQLYTKEHPTYKALMEKRQTLQEQKNKLNKKVSSMPATQQEVLRLSRDVESGRAVYLQLLNRQQELSIAKSSAIGNVRIIDNAVAEQDPIKPNKILIVAVGVLFGLLFSIGLVLLQVFLRRGIESPEQLEDAGINVYASIPVSEWLTKKVGKNNNWKKETTALLATENPTDLAIEAIRGLRTSLHFAMMEAKNNILMISGASPNAGKTFVSTNLAATTASTGKKVLFIDADLRKGYVHKLLGLEQTQGLSEVLSGQCSVTDVVKRVNSGDFDYIGRGQVPPNPAELLMHPRFDKILNWASENYDLVIIDTPPILAVTDAAIIGSYVGTVLLVARFETNTVKEIAVSISRFEQSGIVVKGCILNGVVKKSSNYYGYGYGYYDYTCKKEK
ncbi:TPA: polysaccharide biosynthesis tyrosine autokinase [Klebsiella pneumoniae]|nr:polysaccharide biosynthesis tyrosine autokinase [Klebsiella pneumoniae]